MPSPFDYREHPEARELLGKLPPMQYAPLVGAPELREIVKVLPNLPDLEFPINSAGELIEKLGGSDARFSIAQIEVDPLRMIKYMPAYYFPIASLENFVEKMAELVRQNRKQVDLPRSLSRIRRQLPDLPFPINSADEFLRLIGTGRQYHLGRGPVAPEKLLAKVPPAFFPLTSQEDFEQKVAQLLLNRELIVPE